LTVPDKNEDGVVDKQDLDFVEDENGDFVGDFVVRQADFYPGMQAWGFVDTTRYSLGVDADGALSFEQDPYESCTAEFGYTENTYSLNFRAGLQSPDILNRPDDYIRAGAWVTAAGFTWTDPEQDAEIVLDTRVSQTGE
jgi:hypothetical protein